MLTAVYKEDLAYRNCPFYIQVEGGYFAMEGQPEFRYSEEEVLHSGDFLVFCEEGAKPVYV